MLASKVGATSETLHKIALDQTEKSFQDQTF